MYPFFEISGFRIYLFWFTFIIIFFLFYWMLRKLSSRFNYDFELYRANIFWFFISTFIFSRIFYIISQWNDMKFIKKPFEFFIMSDYNFSLYWAIFWFFLVLLLNLKLRKESIIKYVDWLILSFYFVLFIGYIWAFLWWQVYWKPTNLWIEVSYNNSNSFVPYTVPIFPLPIIYAIISFIVFSFLYILKMYIKTKWFVWYLWLGIFASITLVLEFFSWKSDIFSQFPFNFNQVCALFLLFFTWRILFQMIRRASSEWPTNILDT